MVTFPNCKINLGLNITRKREDGYHDLETVFYPIFIKDVLEVVKNEHNSDDVAFNCTGTTLPGNQHDNLCVKAYRLLKKHFPQLAAVSIHLHKTIPIGAGLGGGSADGAFMLSLLNRKFQLQLTEAQLIGYALELGSDCPFFIRNEPCFATGRGEELQPIALDLSAYTFAIINPGIHINTGWAFSNIAPKTPVRKIKAIIQQPIETWQYDLVNDFEAPVFAAHPEIAVIKENCYAHGAVYASMSGSGSTVFGIFKKGTDLSSLCVQHSNYLTRVL